MQKQNYNLYTCHDSKHIFGTGLVNRRVSHIVTDFEPLGMRMCHLHLKSKVKKVKLSM
jgi:hypothetical protein